MDEVQNVVNAEVEEAKEENYTEQNAPETSTGSAILDSIKETADKSNDVAVKVILGAIVAVGVVGVGIWAHTRHKKKTKEEIKTNEYIEVQSEEVKSEDIDSEKE